ncbi:NTP transferase domain-containing protein [Cellulosimicrobium arenosum]|uniref:Phosphocholine cytidylyltransferase family protein n=1 Tax=Cellulosimicrobium arenosum TaxID=2708133 RepID=A0A927J1I2_9MICO|nr:phosphocholine cytidylyltransferase family protein [Cellulosimicrobium arenosum]MBD8080184.1 phosphocholine cytidylyltransferase family protein [Cellulosimicrobium arenosum]
MSIQAVILAAGMGTRLGRPHPKPLTELRDGRTILAQQLGNLRAVYGREAEVLIVVGFKLDMILEAAPDVTYAYNEVYDQTNTSKSLMRALRVTGDRGVLWMNGDVVFHPDVLRRVQPLIDQQKSFVCVNTSVVGDEEVKYTVDEQGDIAELSKTVGAGALGEAVGINYVAPQDKAKVLQRLVEVDDQAYFERGVELAIERDGVKVTPVDISDLYAVEVDFAEDLERANREL